MAILKEKISCTIVKKSKNKPFKVSRSFNKAFSLLEVSIVILIIGVLIAGVISARIMIKNSRIASAQAITRSAAVNSVPNAVIWLESSLEESFNAAESEDEESLSGWGDIKTGSSHPNNSAVIEVTDGVNIDSIPNEIPEYSNTINDIQAVKFHGSDNVYMKVNGNALNSSDYTIFVLEKRQATGSNIFLETDGTSTADDEMLQLGYSATGTIVHSQGSGNSYNSLISDYDSNGEAPKIFTFIQNSSTGKKTYINGYLSGENPDTTKLTNIQNLRIGQGYTGEIGEFLVFDRALRNEERSSIEKYLQKKWRVNNFSETAQSCTDGEITDSGCAAATCSVSINGSSDTSLAEGASKRFVCDQAGYVLEATTTEIYTCSGGSLTPSTPSISQCIDDNSSSNGGCATGYNADSGTCKEQCSISSQTGIIDGTKVDSGSVSFDCNETGYTGSITYACDGGALTSINNMCDVAAGPVCSGGDIVDDTTIAGDVIHIFTSVGEDISFTCTESVAGAQILIVAGGGSGGAGTNENHGAGGGGAGGLVYAPSYNLSAEEYLVTVGDGGEAQATDSTVGNNGQDSKFNDLTADGGGGGGSWYGVSSVGDGGSGGGSDWQIIAVPGVSTQTDQPSPNGNGIGYGNDGGTDLADIQHPGAGGGGAGDVGDNTSSDPIAAGNGGSGMEFDITGTNKYYAAGGGGGAGNTTSIYGIGGSGIGGNGAESESHQATGGAVNTGSGGGGNTFGLASGAGGSGIVIIRYTNP